MVAGVVGDLALLDAHCHLLLASAVDGAAFERCCTEADRPGPPGVSTWDTAAGMSVRRWCGPVLDLPPFPAPAHYIARREELGVGEVTSRLMAAAGLSGLMVDTGPRGNGLMSVAALGEAAGAPAWEVVRLERVAEEVVTSGVSAGGFASAFVDGLMDRAREGVAVKSVVAYRHGLDIEPSRPSAADVHGAAGEWLAAGGGRLDHPVLLRFLLWAGVDLGLPVQIHTGFGDRDLRLDRSDPSLLQPWLAAVEPTQVPVVLLHGYPYHRQAAWLAAVYPNVHVDVGLTVGQVGGRAEAVLGEYLELAPFAKVLFSTDGYRLPELYLVGAAQFRHGFGRLLDHWIAVGAVDVAEAERVARMVAGDNARRVYRR